MNRREFAAISLRVLGLLFLLATPLIIVASIDMALASSKFESHHSEEANDTEVDESGADQPIVVSRRTSMHSGSGTLPYLLLYCPFNAAIGIVLITFSNKLSRWLVAGGPQED